MNEQIKNSASKILDLIKSSKTILLHCHPGPDPDSVGSALAMKFALEQLGKKVTVIRGDGPMPEAFSHFPGFADIVPKNYLDIYPDIASGVLSFDLFIILDCGSADRVTRLGPVIIPDSMKTVVIDHHKSVADYGKDINLIVDTYPATTLLLYDLFSLWGIQLSTDIAANLFIGMYTDTGGFKYNSVTSQVFLAAAELTRVYPEFHQMIFHMENQREPAELAFEGLAFSNIETFLGGRLAMSAISLEMLREKGISPEDTTASLIAGILKSVVGWDVGACLVEIEPNIMKVSFRTRDSAAYDLSVIARELGGGGHKAAAATTMSTTFDEAKKKIIEVVGRHIT